MPSSFAEPAPKPVKKTGKSNKARAYAQEVRTAKQLSAAGVPANRVPLSGALKGVGLDGDVETARVLLECKSYSTVEVAGEKYIRFPVSWVRKIQDEAKLHGKSGVVVLQPKGAHFSFAVLAWDDYVAQLALLERLVRGEG